MENTTEIIEYDEQTPREKKLFNSSLAASLQVASFLIMVSGRGLLHLIFKELLLNFFSN